MGGGTPPRHAPHLADGVAHGVRHRGRHGVPYVNQRVAVLNQRVDGIMQRCASRQHHVVPRYSSEYVIEVIVLGVQNALDAHQGVHFLIWQRFEFIKSL